MVTSSAAAITGVPSNPPTYTEADWNESSVNEVKEKGKDANNGEKYRASKTLAEQGEVHVYNVKKYRSDTILITDSCVGLLREEQGLYQVGPSNSEPSDGVRSELPIYIFSTMAIVPFLMLHLARFTLCVVSESTQHVQSRMVQHRSDSFGIHR